MGKLFVPIMYILGVTTTMVKVLLVLTFKAVVIGTILLLISWTRGVKKRHYHPEPVYHYRPAPRPMSYAMCPLDNPKLCAAHYQEHADYYEEPVLQGSSYSSYPGKDVLLNQTPDDNPMEINIPVPMYSSNAENFPMFTSDSEKNRIPLEPLEQESNNNEVIEKILANYPRLNDSEIFLTPLPGFATNDEPPILLDPSFLSDSKSPEIAYEIQLPQAVQSSYGYSRRPNYKSSTRRYPYRRYPHKRGRVRKRKDKYGHYDKSPKRGDYHYPYKRDTRV